MDFWIISIPFLQTKESQTKKHVWEGWGKCTCYILLLNSAVLFKVCLKFLFEIYSQSFLIFSQNFNTDPLVACINHSKGLFLWSYQWRWDFFFLDFMGYDCWISSCGHRIFKAALGRTGTVRCHWFPMFMASKIQSWESWATTPLLGES